MGCCQSQDDNFEPSETDPLLPPSSGRDHVPQSNGESGGNGPSKVPNETSKINKILQHTSNNLIDISGHILPADMTEENEAKYRAKEYASKLNRVTMPAQPKLGQGRANPYNILSAPGINTSDIDLVSEAARKTAECMRKVVIHHKEDLVVPFGVP